MKRFDYPAPEGYELTGEFRVPLTDEPYVNPFNGNPGKLRNQHNKRQILRKVSSLQEQLARAEQVVRELKDAIIQARDGHIVSVSAVGGGYRYAYRDPSNSLEIGDLVEVPVTYGTKIGKVVGFGRNGYDGPLKDVKARLERTVIG